MATEISEDEEFGGPCPAVGTLNLRVKLCRFLSAFANSYSDSHGVLIEISKKTLLPIGLPSVSSYPHVTSFEFATCPKLSSQF